MPQLLAIAFAPEVFALALMILALITIDAVVHELDCRSPDAVPGGWIAVLVALRILVCIAIVLLAMYVLLHPIGVMVVLLALAAYVRAIFFRRREETTSTNQLIRLVADAGGSLPDSIEPFARNCRSVIGRRARNFAYLLRCGVDTESAARTSRLSLLPDTIAAINRPQGLGANLQAAYGDRASLANRDSLQSSSLQSPSLSWPASGQLVYLLALVIACLFFGTIHFFVLDTLMKMYDEFGMSEPLMFRWSHYVSDWWSVGLAWIIIVGLIWLGMVVLTAMHPDPSLTRVTPWFGDWLKERNRGIGLDALANGLRRGESLASLLASAEKTTRSSWIRMRSRAALARVSRGEDSANSLRRAGWVSAAEARWLHAAELNQALPTAMHDLAIQIRRRYDLKWQLRLAWLVPAVTLVVGAFVFLQAVTLFQALSGLISGLT